MIGTRLGPYEITAKLGEGGMGEVYRATDTKLDRQVAIKVLPSAFTDDKSRLDRFEREAKVLAQLHHHHIASIFGLEESQGVSALVMELVEGPTLAERLSGGPLPIEEALPIARQIALALETAHEKGIIHRDLKPQNVKLTADGEVRVLDFGLAKAMDPGGTSGAASPMASPTMMSSPTLTAMPGTQLGVILGTAAYMAPEQARGQAVDKRADIWAFGVVLYEMLTGSKLFAADTVSDTLAGVLKTEIDLDKLPGGTPPAIRRLLRRCLERNPKSRLRDVGDARIVIDEVLSGIAEPTREAVDLAAPRRSQRVRRVAPWGVLLVALGSLAGWFLRGTGSGPKSEGPPTLALRRLTDLPGLERQPDLSPDGRQLVYTSSATGNLDLYVMRVDGGRAINITAGSSDDDEQASFSPDGERLVFRSARDGGGLFLMGATGESVRRLTGDGFDPAWSPDGRRVAYSTEAVTEPYSRNSDAELWIADVASGETRQRLAGDAVQPSWSPDGRTLAYWANAGGQRDIWTVGADGGEPVAITLDPATDWSPEWSPDGRWLYFSSDRAGGMNLFRVPIDPASGTAAGVPEQITTSVGNLGWGRFSGDGQRMVITAYEQRSDLELYRVVDGANVQLEPLRTLRPRALHWCQISPAAEWIQCSTIGTPEDLVLLRSDGSELRRLTDDAFKDRNAAWSPNGERLLFQSTRAGIWNLWSLRADGSDPRWLGDFDLVGPPIWSADGQRATTLVAGHGLVELEADRLNTEETLQAIALPDSMPAFLPGGWSPSGRWLGGAEVDSRNTALSIGALDPATGVYRKSHLPTSGPGYWNFGGWLGDSRRFIARGAEQIALVDIETGDCRELLPLPKSSDAVSLVVVSLSRDASTLLVEKPSADGDIWLLEQAESVE